MFPVRNRTSLKPGNPRYDAMVIEATREIEAFLVYNPSRRANCRIDLMHHARGEYKARCMFTSNQGNSHITTVFNKSV